LVSNSGTAEPAGPGGAAASTGLTPADYERIVPFEALLDRIVTERQQEWRQFRRRLHRQPELSGAEILTTQIICSQLQSLGLQPKLTSRGVGCFADLSTGPACDDLPLIAIRADIDGLPLQDRKQAEYSSNCPGKAHACGHDVHTTIALAVAEMVVQLQQRLSESAMPVARLRLLFQPAEEIAEGAGWMIEDGALQDVRWVLGLHVDPTLPAGKVGVRYGVLTAHVDEVALSVQGRGGHAARPQHTTDPLLAAASLVTTLYQQLPRHADALHPTVFSIGSIHGGAVSNVIPDEVQMAGTLRTTNRAVRERVMTAIRSICAGLAQATGNRIEAAFYRPLSSVVNHDLATAACEQAAMQVVGADRVVRISHPSMGGEDFAEYLNVVPGAMFRLGCAGGENWPLLHSPVFDVDESAIGIGAAVLARAALLLALRPPEETS